MEQRRASVQTIKNYPSRSRFENLARLKDHLTLKKKDRGLFCQLLIIS